MLPFSSRMVAFRVASICFERLRAGNTKQEAEIFRDQIVRSYRSSDDVPENSEAWERCKTYRRRGQRHSRDRTDCLHVLGQVPKRVARKTP
mmetsp:Transcript_113087/g.325074  ORF Transcript_113087/g.325074 Transcript_113087/m.325074 type:complete len:91 (-) Transcript_113087:323-595(-)